MRALKPNNVPIRERALISVKEAIGFFSLGRTSLMHVAEENDCVVRIGRKVLIKREAMEKLLCVC